MTGWASQPDRHRTEFILFLQKSKDEKKKKKHKHEEKEEDLLGGQEDEPVVQSQETSEVAAPPTSTSAEVCIYNMLKQSLFPTLQHSFYLTPKHDQIISNSRSKMH